MARKLSQIARRVTHVLLVGAVSLAANTLLAQSEPNAADSPSVVDNPFIKSQPKPEPPSQPQPSPVPLPAVDSQQKALRRPVSYQNPFAATSKLPPVDTSLRPGPISRWRHPVVPENNESTVKSAMLSTPAPKPVHPTWDQLPLGEVLRDRAATRGKETDPTFFARLSTSPSAIQFTPKPLTQPTWLTEFDEVVIPESKPIHVDVAMFDKPLNATGYASQTAALTPVPNIERADQATSNFEQNKADNTLTKADVSPSIVANCVETPEGWLEQAQHAAKGANSPAELSAVVEFCDRGLRSKPDEKQSSSLRRLSAWAHNRRGEMLAETNHGDDVLDDFQAAISLDSNCSLAIHNRAVTLAQQNKFTAALRDFNRVIELNPGLAVAYRNRAELLAALGRTEEAINDYNYALESLPNDAHLYRDRAYAYQQLGEFSKASADFDRAIELSPDDPDALTQRGNLAAEQGNYEQSLADLKQAISKNPSWAEAHRSLAWLQATCPNPSFQNPQEAIAAAERAAKLAPANDYLIFDTLAAAHASAGQFDKASELQQQALTSAPPDAAPSLRQRLALYQQGQTFRNVADETTSEANAPGGSLR